MSNCAGVLLYFFPSSINFLSSISFGSSGFAHGLSGDPNGLYAVIETPFSLQKSDNSFWLKYG